VLVFVHVREHGREYAISPPKGTSALQDFFLGGFKHAQIINHLSG